MKAKKVKRSKLPNWMSSFKAKHCNYSMNGKKEKFCVVWWKKFAVVGFCRLSEQLYKGDDVKSTFVWFIDFFYKPSTLPHRNPLTNVFNHGCISAWWSLPISFDSCPNYAASYCYDSPAVMMLFGWKMRCWHTKFLCNFLQINTGKAVGVLL